MTDDMNATRIDSRRLPAWFAPETRFEVTPSRTFHPRLELDERLEGLKNQLLLDELNLATDPAAAPALRRAANEAAALAWLTPFPLLLLPALLEEKAADARRHTARQAEIRSRSRDLIAEAA